MISRVLMVAGTSVDRWRRLSDGRPEVRERSTEPQRIGGGKETQFRC